MLQIIYMFIFSKYLFAVKKCLFGIIQEKNYLNLGHFFKYGFLFLLCRMNCIVSDNL